MGRNTLALPNYIKHRVAMGPCNVISISFSAQENGKKYIPKCLHINMQNNITLNHHNIKIARVYPINRQTVTINTKVCYVLLKERNGVLQTMIWRLFVAWDVAQWKNT